MSDIIIGESVIEPQINVEEPQVKVEEPQVKVEEPQIKVEVKVEDKVEELLNDEKSPCIFEPADNVVVELTKITFQKMLEELLTQEKQIDKLNIQLSPEVKQYLLTLCKSSPDLLVGVENSLQKIIVDDKINTKDIPEIMNLISKIYELISTNKRKSTIDPYEVISTLLQVFFIVYFDLNHINNPELEDTLLHIIDSAIQLIKLKSFKIAKKGCLSSIFKTKTN